MIPPIFGLCLTAEFTYCPSLWIKAQLHLLTFYYIISTFPYPPPSAAILIACTPLLEITWPFVCWQFPVRPLRVRQTASSCGSSGAESEGLHRGVQPVWAITTPCPQLENEKISHLYVCASVAELTRTPLTSSLVLSSRKGPLYHALFHK